VDDRRAQCASRHTDPRASESRRHVSFGERARIAVEIDEVVSLDETVMFRQATYKHCVKVKEVVPGEELSTSTMRKASG